MLKTTSLDMLDALSRSARWATLAIPDPGFTAPKGPVRYDPGVRYSKRDLTPNQVIHNDNAVIVFWEDGTKTIVRRREGDPDDIHSAFAQALVKKLFGATTTVHKMVYKALKEQPTKQKKAGGAG
jgi:hypothetical protein